MAKHYITRLKRYVRYTLEYFLIEKPRGLDFSMRDKHLIGETNGLMHGYSKTDSAHIKEIFSKLTVDSSAKLLDVGCGKGAFIRQACKEKFGDIAGIEYDKGIYDICINNLKRLKLLDKVKIFNCDAREFSHYGDYNVFYFYNPFSKEIMEKVMDKIVESHRGKIVVILHDPRTADIVEAHGGKMTARLYDKVRNYWTNIYEIA
ncbi:MAG: class I SAM-dependent methyltransferase [Ruminococcus sp.]|nr:class I SAM-dependent methyltransferase [Ruminococcus sp.]